MKSASYCPPKPCDNCPFLREGGIRLTPARVREIAGMMLSSQGGIFTCHKQNGQPHAQHCTGALIFSEKNGTATQMTRIAERIGIYDASAIRKHDDLVFDDVDEMLETAVRR